MTKFTTCLMLALTILPLGAQEKAEPAKKPKAPPIGVLRPPEDVDPTGDVLDLKLNEAAVKLALRQLYQIHQACFAFASGHDQKLPVGKTSNEVFRKLFIAGLVDDEKLFYLSKFGDKKGLPDGNYGNAASGYSEALEPGECNISYVNGLTTDRDDSILPLIFAKITGEDGKIYVIAVRIGGQARVYTTEDGIVRDKRDGNEVDIFSEEYGTDPANIVLPAKKVK